MNVGDVVDAVRACRSDGRQLRVRGGGCSARAPRDGARALSVAELRGVVEYRPHDLVCTARAGTSLATLAAALRERGQRLPFRPWDGDAPERATIGGVFAAGADGLLARNGLRAADHLLGAQAVLSTGDVVRVGARVVKSVAGFDVTRALVGSRGTLAVLTEVTFRVEAVPERSQTFESDAAVEPSDLPVDPAACVVLGGDEPDRTLVQVEGPSGHVDAAGRLLAASGYRAVDAPWERLTRRFCGPPPEGAGRVTGPLRRLPVPSADVLRDLLRNRFTALVGADDAMRAASPRPLIERVRAAFDPDSTLQPGRGWGAR